MFLRSLALSLVVPIAATAATYQLRENNLERGSLGGVVIDASNGRPLAEANVVLVGSRTRTVAQTVTTAGGAFVFTNVDSTEPHRLQATKPGFFDVVSEGSYVVSDQGREVILRPGESRLGLKLALWGPASIAGLVVDRNGLPLVGALVRSFVKIRVAGHDRFAAGPLTRTDDRGIYRLADLRPGVYAVCVPVVQVTVPATASAASLAGLTPEAAAAEREPEGLSRPSVRA